MSRRILMNWFVPVPRHRLTHLSGDIRLALSTKVGLCRHGSSAPALPIRFVAPMFTHHYHTSVYVLGLLPCKLSDIHSSKRCSLRWNKRYFSGGENENASFKKSTARKTIVSVETNDESVSTVTTNKTAKTPKSNQDSHSESITKQLRSTPNLITLGRIASTPLISYLIITERYDIAVAGCIVAGFTDWLDGEIARRYDEATVLGTYLDPLADKMMVNVLSVSLWYKAILPGPIVGLWLARDVALVIATYHTVSQVTKEGQAVTDPSRTPLKVEPTMISKVNTVLQFVTLGTGIMQPLVGIPPNAILGLCWITAGTTISSALSYYDGASLTKSGNMLHDEKNKNE